MKIGLLTLDAQIYNYGGILQEYALCQVIEKLGHSIEIINYDVASELNTFSTKRSLKYLSYDKIVRQIEKKIQYKGNCSNKRLNANARIKFDLFREDYLKISKRYNYRNLNNLENMYDGFVCGSDQIWNPAYNIPSFFLTFVEDKVKVIYAASVGVSSLSRIEKRTYADLLSKLKFISVREKDAQVMLAPLTSSPVEVVLDPTMILDRGKWMNFVQKDTKVEPYLLCYFLGDNINNIKAAKKYAKEHGLKLFVIPTSENDISGEVCSNGIGPVDFLNLIYNANFVLTDSFHASVFSIIFNKPFRVFGRNVGHKNMNDRITTLLDLIGKKEFLVQPEKLDLMVLNENCFYDFSKIDEEGNKSVFWLANALKRGEDEND